MKPHSKPLTTALAALLAIPLLAAPRPLVWRADFPSAKVENFPVRHGTDVDFRPSWHVNGRSADTNGWTYSLSVQTNGAPAGEWATIPGTVFSHTNDCGAEAYNVLVRAVDLDGTVDYSAAARLRMLPSPGFTPGALPPTATFQESDPVFAAWLATFEFPETSLEPATNYANRALADFAATGSVARASSYGTPTRWTDATGCVWEVTWDDWTVIHEPGLSDEDYFTGPVWRNEDDTVEGDPYWYGAGWYVWSNGLTPALLDGGTAAQDFYNVWSGYYNAITTTCYRLLLTNLVGRVAMTNDLPDTVSITNEMAEMRTESSLVYRLYSGSNVVAEVTNYNSQVHAPELRLMQLNESNEYITVWTETNGLARTLAKANEYTDSAITNRAAPRAWSKVTAGMGFEAPSNTTWLSTGRTVIAGGLEYEKHVTSGGAIWLLQSNGMTADFHPQTNNVAFLDLSNADGTPIFRVEKTDSFLVGVHVDRVSIDGSALVCGVNVVAADHPLVRVKASLESGEWAKEEDGIPASLATVTWSGTTGDWTCRIQNNTGGNTLFAHMEYFQEGGTKIVNSAPLDVSQGIICKDGVHKVRPVYSNGNITWEVVP